MCDCVRSQAALHQEGADGKGRGHLKEESGDSETEAAVSLPYQEAGETCVSTLSAGIIIMYGGLPLKLVIPLHIGGHDWCQRSLISQKI